MKERLTIKTNGKRYSYKYLDIDDCMEGTPIDKLGQYEDIDEKLGIDYATLFKAQTEGVWELIFDKYDEEGKPTYKPRKVSRDFYIDFKQKALVGNWFGFGFKDYGKKEPGGWALTREELE